MKFEIGAIYELRNSEETIYVTYEGEANLHPNHHTFIDVLKKNYTYYYTERFMREQKMVIRKVETWEVTLLLLESDYVSNSRHSLRIGSGGSEEV